MRRATLVFILFIVVIAALLGVSRFLQTQPPIDLQVAVSPMALDWINAAFERYNATSPIINTRRVRFVATPLEDMDVWIEGGSAARGWNANNHPAAWIPAWSGSIGYASRMPFTIVEPSLAKTLLVWGGFRSRVEALTTDGSPFDWSRIGEAAAAGRWVTINPDAGLNGNFSLAFNRPTQTMSGFGVMLSGAAGYADTLNLTSAELVSAEFRNWLEPVLLSVPNFNTLGASPAQTIASRGASVGEIALLPENDWLRNLRGQLISADPIVLAYPEHPFVYDFPLAVWSDIPAAGSTFSREEITAAVDALGNYLLGAAAQTAAQTFGLRPAVVAVAPEAALFSAASAYGAQPDAVVAAGINPPSLTDAQRLIAWANNLIR